MAQHVEPMDLDVIHDDKENSLTVSNVLATVDDNDPVENNLKTRYPTTLSKSFAGNIDNKIQDQSARINNMTQSLNVNIKSEPIPKSLPLQNVTADVTQDPNETNNILRQLDSCISDRSDITVNVEDIDYNLSLPSSSSITPEATTPTKEIPKSSGSPIMRSLQSVFNMFRPSSVSDENCQVNHLDITVQNNHDDSVIASTPLVAKKKSEDAKKPEKLVFRDDLEKDLLWEETQIIFSKKEKLPMHKLLFQPAKPISPDTTLLDVSMAEIQPNNTTLEAMEISYNDSVLNNKTQTGPQDQSANTQSTLKDANNSERDDSLFLDCENPSQESFLNDTQAAHHFTSEKITNETAFLENNYINDTNCNVDVPVVVNQDKVENICSDSIISPPEFEVKSGQEQITHENLSSIGDYINTIDPDIKSNITYVTNENIKDTEILKTHSEDDVHLDAQINSYEMVENDNFVDLKKVDENLFLNSDEPTSDNTEEDVINKHEINMTQNKEISTVVSDDIVTTSEESSPFVSIQADSDIASVSESSHVNKTITPPSSPKILAKGFYNFDFDNIEDPFVPKSKIRNSRPPNESFSKTMTENLEISIQEEFKSVEKMDVTNSEQCLLPANDEVLNQTVQIDNIAHEMVNDFANPVENNNITTSTDGMRMELVITTNDKILNQIDTTAQRIDDDFNKPVNNYNITTTLNTTISKSEYVLPAIVDNLNRTVQICTIPQDDDINKPVNNNNITTTLSTTISEYECVLPAEADNLNQTVQINTISQGDDLNEQVNNNNITTTLSTTTSESECVLPADDDNLNQTVKICTISQDDDINQPVNSNNITTTLSTTTSESECVLPADDDNLNRTVQICTISQGDHLNEPINNHNITTTLNTTINESECVLPVHGGNLNQTAQICTIPQSDDLNEPVNNNNITTTLSSTISESECVLPADDDVINCTVQIGPIPENDFVMPVTRNNNTTFSEPAKELNSIHELHEKKEKITNILRTENISEDKHSTNNVINILDTIRAGDNKQEINMTRSLSEIKELEQSVLKHSTYKNSLENLENLDSKMTENINDFNKLDETDIKPKTAHISDKTVCKENHDADISEQMISSQNTDCSASSKNSSDRDITVREVNTEDDDTAEGPFIEAHLEEVVDKANVFKNENIKVDFFNDFVRPKDPTSESSEMFIDAKAFEFLMNQNQSCEISDNGKESLFLKFDPLFAKRVNSDGIVEALAKVQKRQSTPKKMTGQLLRLSNDFGEGPSCTYPACEESTILHEESTDFNLTVNHKPTMVVTPAIAGVSKSDCSPFSPSSRNRANTTFCSPAMTVVDRLLSLSGNNSFNNENTHSVTQNELERNLTELRELVAEKELQNYHFKAENKELKDRLSNMKSKLHTLETESDRRLKNVNDLTAKLAEKIQLNSDMEKVVEEYEKTIGALINKLEEDKKRNADEKMELIRERDEQTSHLLSMEVAFNDLHSKYEKAKQVIMSYKEKFDEYRKSQETFEATVAKIQSNYDALKQHATEKLNSANQELEKINKSHESDVLKLNAMLRRKELQITNLEETLAQKTKAIEELTAICDDLINKVG